MSGTDERTFSVSVPVDRAWRACTHPEELARWFFSPEVGGAPVFGYRQLWTVARATPPSREATASWIRGSELHRGSAVLGPRPAPAAVA
jgi:uncharacterized protein YndB with AHSA1/START domain